MGTTRHRRMRAAIGTLALALLSMRPAVAESLALAGFEAARTSSYGYVGFLAPLGDGTLGSGWVMRHWFDRLTYQYDTDSNTIKALSYAYSPAIGKAFSGDGWGATIYVGIVARHTGLTPDDPGNKNEGDKYRPFIQLDGTNRLSDRVESQSIVQVTAGQLGYYARERILYRYNDAYVAGGELIAKGATEYRGWQAGLVVGGFKLGDAGSVILRGGIAGQSGLSSSAYGAIEFAFPFK